MPPKLSPTMREVLARMIETGQPIVNAGGGFWITAGTAYLGEFTRTWEWNTTAHTVKALEARGLIARTHRFPEAWKDDRELTEAGRVAAER